MTVFGTKIEHTKPKTVSHSDCVMTSGVEKFRISGRLVLNKMGGGGIYFTFGSW